MDKQGWIEGRREEQEAGTPGAPGSPRTNPADLSPTHDDLQQAFAVAGLGVWCWEVSGQSFHWSPELFRIAGRDPAMFRPSLNATLACIHEDDREAVNHRLHAAAQSGDMAGGEFRLVRPDGTEVYCSARISPVVENGRIVALRGILLDLTALRQSELALRASEERYRDTIELSPQMPWTADAQGKITSVSGRWSAITGLPLEAALGDGWLDQLDSADVGAVRQAVAQSLASGTPLDVKARMKCASGELRWIRARAYPKRDELGQVVRWYGLTEDVHEQEQALSSLRESEEHYRYTLELNPQIPWTADPHGKILETGPRWPLLVGTTAAEWAAALHPDDVAATIDRWNHSLRTGEPIDVRYRLRYIDGGYRWYRARAGARRSPSGEIIRWYGVLEDIDEQVAAETTLRAREEWIRQAHEAAGVGLFEVDFDGGFAKLSPVSLAMHGCPAVSERIFPEHEWSQLVRPEDGPRAWAAIERAVATGESYDVTFGVPLSDGSTRWINGRGRIEYHGDGRPRRLLGINFDVTARRTAEAALRESEALNRSIVNASPDGIKLISRSGEILFANAVSGPALELEEDIELVGRNWLDLWPAAAQPRVRQAVAKAAAGQTGRFVAPRATARGRPKWWDVVVAPVLADGGTPLRLLTIARDITDQKAAEDRIHWTATHDPLTRLPNRSVLDERLTEAIAEADAAGTGVALFILDLDQFKQINDTLGHDAGDAVLRVWSDRLRTSFRASDTVARLGGDEFAVVLPGVSDACQATALASEVLARLREPIFYEGASLDCRASIGASIYPQHGSTPGDLLKHADIALYSSKAERRGELFIFAPHMRAELQQRISMTNMARDALHEERLHPFYQPKVDLRTGAVVGFEALARWFDRSGRLHLPGTISAAFEDWDVATAISDRMIEEVVAQMRDWQERGIDFGHVALNASAADFQRADFGEIILSRLRAAGVPTNRLQIEVTESVFFARAADEVERTLGLLSHQGVTIALDDFGTGYASLSHLNRFPVDVIKIDRSFVADLCGTRHAAAIAEAVLTLGRNLGLDVVAEGIEAEAQARRLVELGCPHGQGFLYSAAVPAEDVPALVGACFSR